MSREIPQNATQISVGLWLNKVQTNVLGIPRIRYELYASEGYCFYNNTWIEEERVYWRYISLGFIDISSNFTAIPIIEGIEVA